MKVNVHAMLKTNVVNLINALSILVFVTLMPKDQILISIYLILFTCVAFFNHLFPEFYPRITHLVKSLFTLLLCSIVGINAYLYIPFFFISLLPLFFIKMDFIEPLGGLFRVGCIAYGFMQTHFSLPLTMLLILLFLTYYLERKNRIADGRRHDYSLWHASEHVAIYLYLTNIAKYDFLFKNSFTVLIFVIFLFFISCIFIFKCINLHLFYRVLPDLPRWFDPYLIPYIQSKCKDNLYSFKIWNDLAKPFNNRLEMRFMNWSDIENAIENIKIEKKYDVCVGILSGGGFISKYVMERNGIPELLYIEHTYWSRETMWGTILKLIKYNIKFFKDIKIKKTTPRIIQHFQGYDFSSKKILLIDDSTSSGATMNEVKTWLYERHPTSIDTYALFCHNDHRTDYYHCVDRVPIIWPWGVELD